MRTCFCNLIEVQLFTGRSQPFCAFGGEICWARNDASLPSLSPPPSVAGKATGAIRNHVLAAQTRSPTGKPVGVSRLSLGELVQSRAMSMGSFIRSLATVGRADTTFSFAYCALASHYDASSSIDHGRSPSSTPAARTRNRRCAAITFPNPFCDVLDASTTAAATCWAIA